MIIFTNDKNEIKDVGKTNLEGLTPLEIDDTDNPFKGWSSAKICCYKATVLFGKVTMMTPYVDSRIIEHIEQLGKQAEENTKIATENEGGVIDLSTLIDENNSALVEVSELLSTAFEEIEALKAEIETLKN